MVSNGFEWSWMTCPTCHTVDCYDPVDHRGALVEGRHWEIQSGHSFQVMKFMNRLGISEPFRKRPLVVASNSPRSSFTDQTPVWLMKTRTFCSVSSSEVSCSEHLGKGFSPRKLTGTFWLEAAAERIGESANWFGLHWIVSSEFFESMHPENALSECIKGMDREYASRRIRRRNTSREYASSE